jgi:hypothetical protein
MVATGFTREYDGARMLDVRSALKIEDVLRQHLDRYVSKMGRKEAAKIFGVTATNLDYVRQGWRSRKKKGKHYKQRVPFPVAFLDELAALDDVSLSEKMRELTIETMAMDIASAPEAEASEGAPVQSERADRQK